MKDRDKFLEELLKVIQGEAFTPEVLTNLLKYSRIQSALNERLLAKEMHKVMMRDALSKVINPFYLKPEEAEQLAKGDIILGITPEGHVVSLDLETEFITIISGATGVGKSTMLASILLQLDDKLDEGDKIAGLLE